MLKKTAMLFLALVLIISASAGLAAESAKGKTGKAVKTEQSKYPAAYPCCESGSSGCSSFSGIVK